METVACLHLVKRRGYLEGTGLLRDAYEQSEAVFAKLQAFRSALDGESRVKEQTIDYDDRGEF